MRLQLAGAVLVISALLGAELSALALAAEPASPFWWWMNLEVFRAINATYWLADAVYPLDYQLTIAGLLALLMIAVAAYCWKVRLGLAVLSNLAFFYCGALAFAVFAPQTGPVETASLVPVAVSSDSGRFVVLYLLVSSLCGAAASHLAYFLRIGRWRRRSTAMQEHGTGEGAAPSGHGHRHGSPWSG